jgi:hypothetical protein
MLGRTFQFNPFLYCSTGSTVVHPMLDNVLLMEDQPSNVNIMHFENVVGFSEVLTRILR